MPLNLAVVKYDLFALKSGARPQIFDQNFNFISDFFQGEIKAKVWSQIGVLLKIEILVQMINQHFRQK